MQETNRKRDVEIVRLCHSGMTSGDASQRFGISRDRIRQILRRDERERALAQRRPSLTSAIRLADDLDRGWPMADILEVLKLPSVTRNALELFWTTGTRATSCCQIRLRELMDLITPAPAPRGYMTLPALYIRYVGKCGIDALVRGISRLELSGACRLEWERRLKLFKAEW